MALPVPQSSDEQSVLEVLSALSYRAGELKSYLHGIAVGVSTLIHSDWSVVTLCSNGVEQVWGSTLDLGEATDQAYSLHGTLTGTVVATGSPLLVEDALATPAYGEPPEGYRAYLGVPLRTPIGEVIGTICSFQRYPRRFTPEEVRLASLFAERAAIAIDNYQLYQQQHQFNQALEAEVIHRTKELRAAQAQLMGINRELEQRIEERTAELRQLNEQLQAEIVERKQAEQSLRESEERFRALFEHAGDSLLVFDEQGHVLDANQRAVESLGYSREELLTLSIPDIKANYTSAELETIQEQLTPHQPITLEGFHRRKDGTIFPVEACVRLFEWGGRSLEIALVRDVTERKQVEQERLKAIASLAEVGELTAMIVHEVRNPLTTVLLGLNAFKRLDLPAAVQERLALALEEAERLRNLLNEVLLYAKPQALQRSELELNQWMSDLLDTLCTLPATMKRRLKFIPSPSPVYVFADKDKLKQVLINLIDNACEAVPEGEQVSWRVEPDATMKKVYIRVHNGGEAIAPDILPKLTKPFYTTKPCGTGLGLAIVKRIVEAHGGELCIDSSVRIGTTVSVKLEQLR